MLLHAKLGEDPTQKKHASIHCVLAYRPSKASLTRDCSRLPFKKYVLKQVSVLPEHLSMICNFKAGIEQFLSTYVAFKVTFAKLQTTSTLQHHSP